MSQLAGLKPPGVPGALGGFAAVGAVLLGVALGLTSASAVSGLPSGWGGAIGLGAAHGVDALVNLIPNPQIAGPARLALLLLFGLAGLAVGFWSADAIDAQWEADRTFEPRMSADERAAKIETWHRAVERAKNWAIQ